MGELVLALIIGGLAMVVVERIIRYAWLCLKYRVFAWRPDIYDPELVEVVCDECAKQSVEFEPASMKERGQRLPSDSEVENMRQRIKDCSKHIIEGYCVEFKWQGKATKTPVKIA